MMASFAMILKSLGRGLPGWGRGVELYNIRNDISEASELAASEPERTTVLFAELAGWLNDNVESRYIPKKNSRYNPKHPEARTFENIFEKQGIEWPVGRVSRVK